MIDSKVPPIDSQSLPESSHPIQMADASADQLMSELFGDVERALDGDEEALAKLAQPTVTEPPPAAEMPLSFAVSDSASELLDPATAAIATDLATVSTPLVPVTDDEAGKAPSTTPTPPTPVKSFWTVNRALLGAAGLMMLATLGVWMQQRQTAELAAVAPATVPTEVPVVNANAEFLEYLRRSLEVIAQNATATPTAASNVGEVTVALNGGNGAGLPPMANNMLPPGAPNGVPGVPGQVNVIERVYVPYPASQSAAVMPTPTAPNSAYLPTPSGTTSAPAAAAVNTQTLLGVLELGDRSAALFEIAGVPQRVYIGERIGNSGWLLVSVANEEAVVRRNGEVRTLYIGQEF
ncbi:hypothetical protein [Leptolyngbya iicbica]|uniref:Type II secretion system protein GspC N-terminal domain-containing protein n=2 Tax=Cyanophyceae TaxID=3028117 RepID=A0A4Q7E1C4_9CYAN|nr:hypothetical protein [Leptolyngbya sp. LK]RZM75065.1 hypothetical protein DYY88_22410 [Leptolyngbya sp. LK]